MAARRRFGRVRRLASGRWQARYAGPDGVDRPAPETFDRKADADRWLARKEQEIDTGDWADPAGGRILVADFGASWVTERAGLRDRTRQLYDGLLRLHIAPGLGAYPLASVTPALVRRWHSDLIASGVSQVTAAKAYRLLRSVMGTAVADHLVRSNPCQVKGAGVERIAERPVLTARQVQAIADAMPPRSRLLVLLATLCSLRWGELAALTRSSVDVDRGLIQVRATLAEMSDGRLVVGPPKSVAGRRVVAIPPSLLPAVREHLAAHVAAGPDAFFFTVPSGSPLRRSNFQKQWRVAINGVGVEGLHFHDLRHTGNTLTAQSGATLSDLMSRMGHASTKAAQVYLHTTSDRDRAVAAKLDLLFATGLDDA